MSDTILETIVDKANSTLAQYEALVLQGRFVEAKECLPLIYQLTSQAHMIEDHVSPSGSIGSGLNMWDAAKAEEFIRNEMMKSESQ